MHSVEIDLSQVFSSAPWIYSILGALSISAPMIGLYTMLAVRSSVLMSSFKSAIKKELKKYANPQIQILLHLDKKAEWHPIAKLIYFMNQDGFNVYPI